MFKNAVIIAGGFGTRMLPLTEYVPKPLVKVENKPLIQYTLDLFYKNNIKNISITYGHKAPQLVEYVADKAAALINTIDQDNAYFLYNTIIQYINEPVIVSPCDIVIDIDMVKLYDEYINMGEPTICIVPIKANDSADYIHTDKNRVTKITRTEISGLCVSGIQIINPSKVNKLGNQHNNFYDVWMDMISTNNLHITNTQPLYWKSYDSLKDIDKC